MATDAMPSSYYETRISEKHTVTFLWQLGAWSHVLWGQLWQLMG